MCLRSRDDACLVRTIERLGCDTDWVRDSLGIPRQGDAAGSDQTTDDGTSPGSREQSASRDLTTSHDGYIPALGLALRDTTGAVTATEPSENCKLTSTESPTATFSLRFISITW